MYFVKLRGLPAFPDTLEEPTRLTPHLARLSVASSAHLGNADEPQVVRLSIPVRNGTMNGQRLLEQARCLHRPPKLSRCARPRL